jgi:hypothetical protein
LRTDDARLGSRQVRLLADKPSNETTPYVVARDLRWLRLEPGTIAVSAAKQAETPQQPQPAVDKSAPTAGVLGARMVGCATSKNFADRVPVYFAVNSVPPFSLRGAYASAPMPTDAPVSMVLPFGHLLPPSLAIRHLAGRRIISDEVGVVQPRNVANTR